MLIPSPAPTAETKAEAPPLLAELTPEQFQLWRRHPVSALLLERFLPDFRRALERDAVGGWLNNRLSLIAEQEVRGRLLAFNEIEQLSLGAMRVFYGLPEKSEEDKRR